MLTGEVGTGKTTLIHFLLDKLNHGNSPVKTAFLFNPKLTVNDFIEYILKDLGVQAQNGTKGDHLHLLYESLIESYKNKERVVLIIDEAQGLNPALLEEIRLLSNLETAKSKLLQIILAGPAGVGRNALSAGFSPTPAKGEYALPSSALVGKRNKRVYRKEIENCGRKKSHFYQEGA